MEVCTFSVHYLFNDLPNLINFIHWGKCLTTFIMSICETLNLKINLILFPSIPYGKLFFSRNGHPVFRLRRCLVYGLWDKNSFYTFFVVCNSMQKAQLDSPMHCACKSPKEYPPWRKDSSILRSMWAMEIKKQAAWILRGSKSDSCGDLHRLNRSCTKPFSL